MQLSRWDLSPIVWDYGRVFVSKNANLLVLFNPGYGGKIRSVIPLARVDHLESDALVGGLQAGVQESEYHDDSTGFCLGG